MTSLEYLIMVIVILFMGLLTWRVVLLRIEQDKRHKLVEICSINPRPSKPHRKIRVNVSKLRWSLQMNNPVVETMIKDVFDYYDMDNSHDVDTFRSHPVILDSGNKALLDTVKETMRKIDVSAVEITVIILRRYENKIRAKFRSLKVIVSHVIYDATKFKQDQGGAKDDEPSNT
jgi:hypothetical protein